MLYWQKKTTESLARTIDFTDALAPGDTVASAVIAAVNSDGDDVSDTLLYNKSVTDPYVSVTVLPSTSGTYTITFTVTTTAGYIIVETVSLNVDDGTDLITIEEMRRYPGFESMSSAKEQSVASLIAAVTAEFEEYWGAYGVQRSISERSDYERMLSDSPGFDKIWLSRAPIVSVTSIIDPAGNSVASTGYRIDCDLGCLYAPGGWQTPVDANGFAAYFTVTYVSGWVASPDLVPANIKQACKMRVAGLYDHPDREMTSKKVGDLTLTYAVGQDPAAIPDAIRGFIRQWKMEGI
jgi:hypothetical protein